MNAIFYSFLVGKKKKSKSDSAIYGRRPWGKKEKKKAIACDRRFCRLVSRFLLHFSFNSVLKSELNFLTFFRDTHTFFFKLCFKN